MDNRWAPFNSVINGTDIVSEILDKKSRINKPILSEEMIESLENDIIISYQSELEVLLRYYKDHKIKEITGIITKLDPINKRIIINNTISLYFTNIIQISIKNT